MEQELDEVVESKWGEIERETKSRMIEISL